MTRIFLIGLMGSGKTYWGERLAQLLRWRFADLDRYIETKEKQSIPEIFSLQGEKHFRSLESKYLRDFETMEQVVVAAGGGTPCFHNNMQLMNGCGSTFYLKAKPETVSARLKDEIHSRPLLKGKTVRELPAFFEQQLKEREPFYRLASHTIEAEKITSENLPELFFLKPES